MKVKSESEVSQSHPTLGYPMDYSLPGSSVHGIFQAKVLEWGATRIRIIPLFPNVAFTTNNITGNIFLDISVNTFSGVHT